MRRLGLIPLILMTATACENSAAPVPPESTPAFTISDAVHSAGNSHFYFLPPMVSPPAFSGIFDPAADAVVHICVWAGSACGATVATYAKSSGPGGELVVVDPVAEAYSVKWRTKDFAVDPGQIYRVEVLVGVQVLGFADVQVVLSNKEAKNVNTGEFIPLVDGHILAIRFRIEQGAIFPVGPVAITINATALSATSLDLLSVGSFATVSAMSVTLTPGITYTIRYYAGVGYPSADFAVTAAGKVDYSPQLDSAFSGRGTSTLVVSGFPVSLDATALTAPQVDLLSVVTFPTTAARSLRLLPGPHHVRYYAAAGYPGADFSVGALGYADFPIVLDGVLLGRGTRALTVRGRDVPIDATALTVPRLSLTSVDPVPVSTATVRTATLLPGAHELSYYAGGGSLTSVSARFTVDAPGHVDYDVTLDTVLVGRGTGALTVRGRDVDIDATALSAPKLSLTSIDPVPVSTATARRVTLLPGTHDLSYYAGAGPLTGASASFSVDAEGHVDYAVALEGVFGGRGTDSLLVTGLSIGVNAMPLGVATFDMVSLATFAADPVPTLQLLPGQYGVNAGTLGFTFSVGVDGKIAVNALLYPYLDGAGTSVLTINAP